ncbi:uncharacterized protein LOC112452343 [Temnothorax curvispinosus]|uniref:Uncharacterized protein LOC112452343 n=1 Tax=Temnothorax curvispinosus TaxID=300111 RepID=A0A6J1PG63_9HYME|nr:uncharacterized protein LOC112452343 [Temnothorax curvispinosus]
MIYLVTSRLDPNTRKAWETSMKKGEVPTLKQLTDFLAQQCKALEASSRTVPSGASGSAQGKHGQSKSTSANIATTSNKCAYCKKEDHAIYKCGDYLQLEVDKRIKEARSRKLCLNCLKDTSHIAKQCSLGLCRKCNKRHNTLLHLEQSTTKTSESTTEDTSTANQEKVVATSVNHSALKPSKQVLLATALVKITDSKGDKVVCRALLDSGSQSCFITSSCAKRLSLKQFSTHIPVCGLGEMSTQTNKRVKVILHSRINKFSANLDCLIIDRITQSIPVNRINVNELQVPEGILLADPEFYKSSKVDLLLGAEIFFDLMCIGKIKNSKTQPTWQKTILGWIASGNLIVEDQKHKKTICGLALNEQLNLSLTRFWQMEHIQRQNTRTPEERMCEGHFARTYKRNKEGRFVVSLPTKEKQLQKLGDSRDLAIQQLKHLERRFARQPQLKEDYAKFMREYLNLGHMREVPENSARWNIQPQYYMPHHCVIKESSATTKLRVVFNASSKTTSGISLNNALMAGPVLQQDLFSILLRFRRFIFVMTADIAKMYRQVLVEEDQVALQRIV